MPPATAHAARFCRPLSFQALSVLLAHAIADMLGDSSRALPFDQFLVQGDAADLAPHSRCTARLTVATAQGCALRNNL